MRSKADETLVIVETLICPLSSYLVVQVCYKLLQYKIVIMSLWLLFVTITITKQCDGGLALVFLAQGIYLHNLLKNAVGQTSIFGKTGN